MKKNVKVFALAGIGAVALVGGTFAYYSSTQSFDNNIQTTKYGSSAVEKFNPPTDWVPGATVDKEIYATNTGDGNVWVRVKFDEKWKRNNSVIKEFSSQDNGFNTAPPAIGKVPAAGDNQNNATDGETDADTGSVVYKKLENTTTTLTESNKWYYNSTDGYYYYTSALDNAGNKTTVKLLDDITLCQDTDMGLFENKSYYFIRDTELSDMPVYPAPSGAEYAWIEGTPSEADKKTKYVYAAKENKVVDGKLGYAKADYTLTITTEFIQADEVDGTSNAAEASGWNWFPGKK